jgi:hypothetical protein
LDFNAFAESLTRRSHATKTTNKTQKLMKKLLLIALAISGFGFAAHRSDAQAFVRSGIEGLSFGFPGGYHAYPRYLNYYPYGYSLRPYVSYSQSYYYGPAHTRYGARTHHRQHRTYHRH